MKHSKVESHLKSNGALVWRAGKAELLQKEEAIGLSGFWQAWSDASWVDEKNASAGAWIATPDGLHVASATHKLVGMTSSIDSETQALLLAANIAHQVGANKSRFTVDCIGLWKKMTDAMELKSGELYETMAKFDEFSLEWSARSKNALADLLARVSLPVERLEAIRKLSTIIDEDPVKALKNVEGKTKRRKTNEIQVDDGSIRAGDIMIFSIEKDSEAAAIAIPITHSQEGVRPFRASKWILFKGKDLSGSPSVDLKERLVKKVIETLGKGAGNRILMINEPSENIISYACSLRWKAFVAEGVAEDLMSRMNSWHLLNEYYQAKSNRNSALATQKKKSICP